MLAGLAVLFLALGATAQRPFSALLNITDALSPSATANGSAVGVMPATSVVLNPDVLLAPSPLDVEAAPALLRPTTISAVTAPVLAGEAPTRVAASAPPLAVRLATCTDVPPGLRHTCAEQKAFGKCTSEYILRYAYCARTCGLPPCATPELAAITANASTITAAPAQALPSPSTPSPPLPLPLLPLPCSLH
ncbi:hypothetical protein V8C86DRAFT_647081 [Haematococcus lacustris]